MSILSAMNLFAAVELLAVSTLRVAAVSENSSHISGPPPPPPPPTCNSIPNVILGFGNNLPDGQYNVASEAVCCETCSHFGSGEECKSWTYHKSEGMAVNCYLHGSVEPRSTVGHGVVSGVPNGNVPPPPPPSRHCVGNYRGCFKDFIPAPGVPPVRALTHQVLGPSQNMTVANCSNACVAAGFSLSGVTVGTSMNNNPLQIGYVCWCGCSINGAATTLANSTCAAPCRGAPNGDGPCGGPSAMAVFDADCVPGPDPSIANKTCPGGQPLPPGPACSQAASKNWSFCNTSLDLDTRVNDLVDRITLAEAGALLTARQSPEIPRLGIPSFYWGTNAIHGVQWINATSFPQAINLGCTWNRTVMRGVGRTIGREMRALSNIQTTGVGLTSWSPTINIIRDPRWGRNQETISEDPLLAGEYGAQFSLGMQFDWTMQDGQIKPTTPSSGDMMVVASLKHVLGYSLEQWSPDGNWSRNMAPFNAIIDPYDIEDTYTQPFKRSIENGGSGGIMYACNMVNSVPAVASLDLASRLRSWGFTGYRTTDGDGIGGITDHNRQNYTSTIEEAIRVALTDGESDIDDGSSYQNHLIDALEQTSLNTSIVKRALFNTFRMRFRLGLFDPVSSSKWSGLDKSDINTLEAKILNVEASRQSLVLLKNTNKTLPFRIPKSGNVVVIGPSGNSTRLLGGGHYAKTLPVVDGFETGGYPGIPQAIEVVLGKLNGKGRRNTGPTVQYFPGMKCSSRPDSVCIDPKRDVDLMSDAVSAAKSATQVVIVVNLQSRSPCDSNAVVAAGGEFNPCGYEGEQHDRSHIGVPKYQHELAMNVLAATQNLSIPTAVVLVHGGALAIEEIKKSAPAILDAHYPGEVTGAQAVADALYGIFSPSGKLTYSVMPEVFVNTSNFTHMSMTEGPGRSYKYYPRNDSVEPVLYPFGWGLTYSSFNMSLEKRDVVSRNYALGQDSVFNYSVTVSNVGDVDSSEVIQVYMVPKLDRQNVPTPFKQLIDFKKVFLIAGSTAKLNFSISPVNQMMLVNSDGSRKLVPGDYEILFTNGVYTSVTAKITLQ